MVHTLKASLGLNKICLNDCHGSMPLVGVSWLNWLLLWVLSLLRVGEDVDKLHLWEMMVLGKLQPPWSSYAFKGPFSANKCPEIVSPFPPGMGSRDRYLISKQGRWLFMWACGLEQEQRTQVYGGQMHHQPFAICVGRAEAGFVCSERNEELQRQSQNRASSEIRVPMLKYGGYDELAAYT